jgi:hypothetical protein
VRKIFLLWIGWRFTRAIARIVVVGALAMFLLGGGLRMVWSNQDDLKRPNHATRKVDQRVRGVLERGKKR